MQNCLFFITLGNYFSVKKGKQKQANKYLVHSETSAVISCTKKKHTILECLCLSQPKIVWLFSRIDLLLLVGMHDRNYVFVFCFLFFASKSNQVWTRNNKPASQSYSGSTSSTREGADVLCPTIKSLFKQEKIKEEKCSEFTVILTYHILLYSVCKEQTIDAVLYALGLQNFTLLALYTNHCFTCSGESLA